MTPVPAHAASNFVINAWLYFNEHPTLNPGAPEDDAGGKGTNGVLFFLGVITGKG